MTLMRFLRHADDRHLGVGAEQLRDGLVVCSVDLFGAAEIDIDETAGALFRPAVGPRVVTRECNADDVGRDQDMAPHICGGKRGCISIIGDVLKQFYHHQSAGAASALPYSFCRICRVTLMTTCVRSGRISSPAGYSGLHIREGKPPVPWREEDLLGTVNLRTHVAPRPFDINVCCAGNDALCVRDAQQGGPALGPGRAS